MFSPPLKFPMMVISCALASGAPLGAAELQLPSSIAGRWEPIGRVKVTPSDDKVTIAGGYVADLQELQDYEMSFKGRMPEGAEQVQIWGAIRVKDRHSRYVFGLRGGVEPQLSLARYAPDGTSKFLGFVGLDFLPQPGEWYTLRVAAVGKRFHVYLNDEKLPRINIEDTDALWTKGGVGLGGGWLPTEFSSLSVTPIEGRKLAEFKAVGNKVWSAPELDRKKKRSEQRAAYTAAKVAELPPLRGEFSIDGNWLFQPDQDLASGVVPSAEGLDDQDWHVLSVPSFWTPTIPWLSGEFGLPGLKGVASNKGPSDKLMVDEYKRVDSQTFDWRKTNSGWYRHYFELPNDLKGKRFEVVFGAIAKISEVWVNGVRCGSSVGMFREVRADITKALKPGRNVIAVHTLREGNFREVKEADKVVDVAVTVPVTNAMLYSLPHGMTSGPTAGGIWQPVKLVITEPVRVSDVFVQPQLDKAKVTVEVSNDSSTERTVQVGYVVRDRKEKSTLVGKSDPQTVRIPPNGTAQVEIETPQVAPKLWSPDEPNLYTFDISVTDGGKTLDEHSTVFGFRTFTVENGKIMLNGKPYWLRGGNHFPATLRPNDALLAKRFIDLAREGNVRVTRSHGIPLTETWFKAADEQGMGISFEGTWPWLMLRGLPPDPELLKVWKEEFASLLKRHRNHPSLLIWTVNNEMKFSILEELGDDVLKQKWTVLDDMIKTMRKIDPTRPIVADSAYTRTSADKKSKKMREENQFDDGDIDDAHRYYGWYNESPFNLFDGSYGKKLATPGRPLISQEMATGYPRNDDWPSRSYQFPRYVPQALVGNYAFEQNDPSIFMARQAFMTKEVGEVIRRTNREEANGVLHFAYLTWFTNVWDAETIKPKLTYYELSKALQPVLVSAELFGRHFYAGDTLKCRVAIVNDHEGAKEISAGTLRWEFRDGDKVLGSGSQPSPSVPYYQNKWVDVTFEVPAQLPSSRVDGKLVITLESDGKIQSKNDYDVLLAARDWAQGLGKSGKAIKTFDPKGRSKLTLASLGLGSVDSLDRFADEKALIIGDTGALLSSSGGAEKLRKYVEEGGKVLLLQPGADLVKIVPEVAKSYRKTKGEIVSMEVPESPVFDGIEPLDTAWFESGVGNVPFACGGTYEIDRSQPGVEVLAHECKIHPDIDQKRFFKDAGAPLVEIRLGKGIILASEMNLASQDRDPVAGRLLRNMIEYIAAP